MKALITGSAGFVGQHLAEHLSNEGDEKEVACESMEQFMNVLNFVRDTCPEERLSYSNPL